MNILVIYDGYSKIEPKGSVPSVVFYLAKTMVKMGHNVTILERKQLERDTNNEYIVGIKFVRLRVKKFASGANEVLYNFPLNLIRVVLDGLIFALKVNSWLEKREEKFDIIQVHQPLAIPFLIIFNRKLRKKLVYTFHGDTYRLNLESKVRVPWYVRLLSPDLFLMRRVSKVIVLNESVYSKLVMSKKILPKNIIVIGNGIDSNVYHPDVSIGDIRSKYEMEGKVVILFAGVIFPRKGVEYLIKTANIVINKFGYNDVLFLLAGDLTLDKKYVSRMLHLICKFGLNEKVKLIGRVPHEELIKLYVASDLFICPSPEEPFPTVVLEAMACGKPVIGTSVGGMLLQIKDGSNGFLVEPKNEVELSEKIKYLINHPEERIRMGMNSRRRVEEEFSWERVACRYLSVYHEVAK